MKKTITSLLLLIGLCATAQVKIGDNPTTIGSSSVLELESTNKAFVITRVANTTVITNPVNGMLVYDLSSNCVKFYENGVWSNCISTGTTSVVQGILAQIGLEADNPDVLPSTVTAVQLSQVGVTGVTPANIGAYQAYIDANPDNFSNPATASEVQAAITAVNTSAATSGGTATVSSFACNTASVGTLTNGMAASGVTQTITANVTTVGTYSITAISNGITFTGTGTFAGTGNQNVILTATGTPTVGGTNTFTLNTTPDCSFTRDVIDVSSGGTAVVSSMVCNTASFGELHQNVPISGSTQTITATVVTAGTYSITTTANGITFSNSGTFPGTGEQTIVLNATGTPTTSGTNTFNLNTTPSCSFDRTVIAPTAVVEVTTPTGKVWMDRNLGAQRVATSLTDSEAFGFYYQWGRGNDGHQVRTSTAITTLSATDTPNHSFWIQNDDFTGGGAPYDWRSPQNDNLWQGVNGVNNPCPTGYRVPTLAEFQAEAATWSSQDSAGAFASPLKLPYNGQRQITGAVILLNDTAIYWTSTTQGTQSRRFYIDAAAIAGALRNRALGLGIRCIKD